jgi:hypothetical protein
MRIEALARSLNSAAKLLPTPEDEAFSYTKHKPVFKRFLGSASLFCR